MTKEQLLQMIREEIQSVIEDRRSGKDRRSDGATPVTGRRKHDFKPNDKNWRDKVDFRDKSHDADFQGKYSADRRHPKSQEMRKGMSQSMGRRSADPYRSHRLGRGRRDWKDRRQDESIDFKLRMISERSLTKSEESKREQYLQALKSREADFKKKYGARWQEVMYAVATNKAKEAPDA